jgi:hypothetical protein
VRLTTREEARDMEEPGSVETERLAVPEPDETPPEGEGEEER